MRISDWSSDVCSSDLGLRARRAVVKTRLVRIGTKGMPAVRAHLRYIQRDGVTREGTPGELYSADRDTADDKAFLQRCDGDRHQFRFIVSAEDGSEYPDLKPYIRRLMTQKIGRASCRERVCQYV